MPYLSRAAIDPLRSLGFASISGTYAAVGVVFAHPVRVICVTNNTDADMFFSDDGVNNKLFLAANSFKLFDVCTNRDGGVNETLKFGVGVQFYVKESTAPSKGAVYIECIYASGE